MNVVGIGTVLPSCCTVEQWNATMNTSRTHSPCPSPTLLPPPPPLLLSTLTPHQNPSSPLPPKPSTISSFNSVAQEQVVSSEKRVKEDIGASSPLPLSLSAEQLLQQQDKQLRALQEQVHGRSNEGMDTLWVCVDVFHSTCMHVDPFPAN